MRRSNQRRGNRNGNRGPRGGGRHGGRGGGRHGRGGGGRRYPRQSAESGNLRERIAIESGELVLIDQFMLANPEFVEKIANLVDEDPGKKNEVIIDFGGKVISLERGTYKIERDPFASTIIVHPEGEEIERASLNETATDVLGNIYIDTRCLAMVDKELLDDTSLLEKYQQLWFSGQDKACRDLLRDNGGAVRYGFKRDGDELGIYQIPGENVICLWPEAEEPAAAANDS